MADLADDGRSGGRSGKCLAVIMIDLSLLFRMSQRTQLGILKAGRASPTEVADVQFQNASLRGGGGEELGWENPELLVQSKKAPRGNQGIKKPAGTHIDNEIFQTANHLTMEIFHSHAEQIGDTRVFQRMI